MNLLEKMAKEGNENLTRDPITFANWANNSYSTTKKLELDAKLNTKNEEKDTEPKVLTDLAGLMNDVRGGERPTVNPTNIESQPMGYPNADNLNKENDDREGR